MTNLANLRDFSNLLDHWVGLDHFLTLPTYQKASFPPYDIIRKEDEYAIVVALAGYKADDITVTLKDDVLVIESQKTPEGTTFEPKDYIHKGIAKRSFKLSFNLSPEVVIDGSTLADGMLTINMHRIIPEAKQPKQIPIISG